MKKFWNNKNYQKWIPYGIFVILTILLCIPLFQSNMNMKWDDGIQHIARIMGTYQSLSEGQKFPVIMSLFCNEFGYSWNLFYSPLTAYLPLLFSLVTTSFTVMLKLFLALAMLLSGIFMYHFVITITKNKKIGVLAAGLYMMAPYHLTDLYLRMAVAEFASFVFIPMVFLGLYHIFHDTPKKGYWLCIGAVGLILTHTLSTIIVAIFAVIYILCHFFKWKDKRIWFSLFLNLFLVLAITSFFWLPLVQLKMDTSYEVFVPGRMERGEVLEQNKLKFYDLFFTKEKTSLRVFELGIVTIVALILTPLARKRIEPKNKITYYSFLGMGLMACLMTLTIFPFEKMPSFITKLQFPWRMIEFANFFFSVIAAINLGYVIKSFQYRDVIFLLILQLALTAHVICPKIPTDENYQEDDLWPAVAVTEKTGRVHAGMASMEYLPSKAFQNRSYIEKRPDTVFVLQGQATILQEQKENTNLEFTIQVESNQAKIELPFIYYLGYTVMIEKQGIAREKIQYNETENGFIGITLPQGEYVIQSSYTGTNSMKVSAVISLFSFLFAIGYYLKINPTKHCYFRQDSIKYNRKEN